MSSELEAAFRTFARMLARELARELDRPKPEPELIPLSQAGPPVRTLRAAIRSGALPAVKTGRCYMISRSDLQSWLAARTVKPNPARKKPVPSTAAERAIQRARDDGRLRVIG